MATPLWHKIIRAFLCPDEFLDIFDFSGEPKVRQGFQHSLVIPFSGGCPIVQNAHHAGVGFGADGPPLALVEEERIYINRVTDAVRQAQAEISTPIPEVAPYTGRPVYQATAFCSRKEDPLLRALLPTGCKLARWSEGGVDIIPEAGGKAAGMRRFLTRFGLSRLECMAFGDAENDLDMLAYAGIGVSMGNASEAVKHAADYVTASVDEKGIEQALRHFRLI